MPYTVKLVSHLDDHPTKPIKPKPTHQPSGFGLSEDDIIYKTVRQSLENPSKDNHHSDYDYTDED